MSEEKSAPTTTLLILTEAEARQYEQKIILAFVDRLKLRARKSHYPDYYKLIKEELAEMEQSNENP